MNKKLQRLLIVIAVILAATVGLQQAGRIAIHKGLFIHQWAAGFWMLAGLFVVYIIIRVIIDYINGND